ncbi:MAG TPA: DUF6174 domain-containing protein [Cellvibrionaceae bacterium]
MKNWIQSFALLIFCSQMAGCGGGDSKSAASIAGDNNVAASNSPKALPADAEAKALTESFINAQALWANTAPTNYHYSFKEGGFGYKFDAYNPVTIWVREGKISQVISGIQVLNSEDYQQASIEQIFTRLAYTLGHSPADTHFHVEYDALLGFPTLFKATPGCCAQGMQLIVTDLHIDP